MSKEASRAPDDTYLPTCDFDGCLLSVALELSGQKKSGLRYVNLSYRTENYQLVQPVSETGLAALQVDLNEVRWKCSRVKSSI